ncbi:hypothetical protein COV13_00115 [Candidatus Woesearchaeota archaeon CG10_big_fil_rev_8_21_14_0_10_32_9]|nr:MAG: hypothetical protein COV13_00115 [Candidatus Woesearchaeota archaeon CG10_big_fil_rev_8_21_14_0_10_32_9]
MNSEEIAINVAIIPPEEIITLAVEINKESNKQGNKTKDLRMEDFIPHITLFMGIIKSKDLTNVRLELEKLIETTRSFKLTLLEIKESQTHPSEESYISVEKNDNLQKLHDKITSILSKHTLNLATPTHLYDGEKTGIGKNTKNWLETYAKTSTYKNYFPHLTLRCKKIETKELPKTFMVNTIGIFHAGDGATCRTLLKEYNIKK